MTSKPNVFLDKWSSWPDIDHWLAWGESKSWAPGWGHRALFEAQPCEYNVLHLNPLGAKSGQHQFSPNNISRSSRVKVSGIAPVFIEILTIHLM